MRAIPSLVSYELDSGALESELERIVAAAGDTGAVVQIVSGQVARGFLDRYIPAAIISDTGFPMNGIKTVQWLLAHDYRNYPLIGLSATPLSTLPQDVAAFYMTSNARYFDKTERRYADIISQLVFNTEFTRRTYGTK